MKEVFTTLLPSSHDENGMGLEKRRAIAEGNMMIGNVEEQSNCSGIAHAKDRRIAGRPTSSRDKAPYEEKKKRSRFCGICRVQGHKGTTCPEQGDVPKAQRKLSKCTKCGVLGPGRMCAANLLIHSSQTSFSLELSNELVVLLKFSVPGLQFMNLLHAVWYLMRYFIRFVITIS